MCHALCMQAPVVMHVLVRTPCIKVAKCQVWSQQRTFSRAMPSSSAVPVFRVCSISLMLRAPMRTQSSPLSPFTSGVQFGSRLSPVAKKSPHPPAPICRSITYVGLALSYAWAHGRHQFRLSVLTPNARDVSQVRYEGGGAVSMAHLSHCTGTAIGWRQGRRFRWLHTPCSRAAATAHSWKILHLRVTRVDPHTNGFTAGR